MNSIKAQKVIINTPYFGRRIVFGVDVNTGKKDKPFVCDPFKHGTVGKKELKQVKLAYKNSKDFNAKPQMLTSNSLN